MGKIQIKKMKQGCFDKISKSLITFALITGIVTSLSLENKNLQNRNLLELTTGPSQNESKEVANQLVSYKINEDRSNIQNQFSNENASDKKSITMEELYNKLDESEKAYKTGNIDSELNKSLNDQIENSSDKKSI